MKPVRDLAVAVVAASLAGLGCNSVATESVPNTEGTDRIWAASNTYCARTSNGLICWEADAGNVAAREPTVFDGVGKVTALALRKGEGCAVSDLGMGCFRLSDRKLARGGADVPSEFVAFGGAKIMHCARGAEGVSCFGDKIEDLKPAPAFEKPSQLHPTLRGNGTCAEYEYELRCFTTDADGKLQATLRLRGVRGARAIRIDEEKGWVLVLDGSGLKFSAVKAEAVRGRPVTDDNAKNFPDNATIELTDVEGVKGPKKLTADSTSTYVLDEEGVKSIAMSEKGLELQLWPLSFKPTELWQGNGSVFFVAHEGELSMLGWKDGERYGKVLRGVKNPKDVAAGELYTCVVHDGGISCVKNLLDQH
jgi:hypothetical protein